MKYLIVIAIIFFATNVYGQTGTPGEPTVYAIVEQMPAPGYNIAQYLSKNLHYPALAKKNKIQGRVIVKYVVNEDGSLSDFTVLKGIGSGCDEEALRVLKNMPAWKPGKKNGKTVKVYYTQPITFKLD